MQITYDKDSSSYLSEIYSKKSFSLIKDLYADGVSVNMPYVFLSANAVEERREVSECVYGSCH